MLKSLRHLVYYSVFFACSLLVFLPLPFLEDVFPAGERLSFFVDYGKAAGKLFGNLFVMFGFLYFVSGVIVSGTELWRKGELGFVLRRSLFMSGVFVFVGIGLLFFCVEFFGKFEVIRGMSGVSWELLSAGWQNEFADSLVALGGKGDAEGNWTVMGFVLESLDIGHVNVFAFLYEQNYLGGIICCVALLAANIQRAGGRKASILHEIFYAWHSVVRRIFGYLFRFLPFGFLLILAHFFDFYVSQVQDEGRLLREILPFLGGEFLGILFVLGCLVFAAGALYVKRRHRWTALSLYFEMLILGFIPYGTQVFLFRIVEHFSVISQRYKRAVTGPLLIEGTLFHYGKGVMGGVLFALVLKFYGVNPADHFGMVLLFGGFCGVLPLYFLGFEVALLSFFLREFFGINDQSALLFFVPLGILSYPVAGFVNAAVLLLKNIILVRGLERDFVVREARQESAESEKVFPKIQPRKSQTYAIPFRWFSVNISILVIVYMVFVSFIFYRQFTTLTQENIKSALRSHKGIIKHVSQSLSAQIQQKLQLIQENLAQIVRASRGTPNLPKAHLFQLYSKILQEQKIVRYVAVSDANGNTYTLKRLPKNSFKLLNASFQRHKILQMQKFDIPHESFISQEDIIYIHQAHDFKKDACHTKKRFQNHVYWSKPHWFPLEFQFGLVACGDLSKASGRSRGFVKVGIRLSDITDIIKAELPRNFESYIFDSRSQILVSSYKYPVWQRVKSKTAENQELYQIIQVNEYPEERITALHSQYVKNKTAVYEYHAAREIAFVRDFSVTPNLLWNIAVLAVLDVQDLETGNWYVSVLMAALLLILLIWIIQLVFAKVDHSFAYIDAEIQQIQQLNFHINKKAPTLFTIQEIIDIRKAFTDVKKILRVIKRYIPVALLPHITRLESSNVKLGGVKREITILFTDIADFTNISEKSSIEELFKNLSLYFTYAEQIIRRTQGTIDKYIGDAIMAFWGAPDRIEDHSYQACISAIACQEKFQEITASKALTLPFHTRMGLHSDSVIVGNVGSLNRLNYTTIGDGVNLASRIEGLNKIYGTSIMISKNVKEQISGRLEYRIIDKVAVKGKEQGTEIYQLLGTKGNYKLLKTPKPLSAMQIESFLAFYEEALDFYFKGLFEQCIQKLHHAQKLNSSDQASSVLLLRCQELLKNPPKDWSGIYQLHTK